MKVKIDIEKMIEKVEYLMLINMEDALTEENKTLKNLEIGYALEYFQTASWLKELKEIKKGGEWLENDETQDKSVSMCSKCGHKSIRYMYCPHCGTKMNNWDEGEDE